MAITFDFYRSPSLKEADIEGKERYHARVVNSRVIEMDDLVEHISRRCTLSKGDIHAVIGELADELALGLKDGNRVNIPGIGQFYLSLSAPKDADPKKTHAQSIEVKNIEYRADAVLKKDLKTNAEFERTEIKIHSAPLTIYEVDALLVDYFEENTFITRERFAKLCNFTDTTAKRHLKRLVEEGRLTNTNKPHNPVYQPAKGYYGR